MNFWVTKSQITGRDGTRPAEKKMLKVKLVALKEVRMEDLTGLDCIKLKRETSLGKAN